MDDDRTGLGTAEASHYVDFRSGIGDASGCWHSPKETALLRRRREPLPAAAVIDALVAYPVTSADTEATARRPRLAQWREPVDLTSGVTPQEFLPGEWFVGTAILSSVVYVICSRLEPALVPATLVAFGAGLASRLIALFRPWEEPEPWAPPELVSGGSGRKSPAERLRGQRRPCQRTPNG